MSLLLSPPSLHFSHMHMRLHPHSFSPPTAPPVLLQKDISKVDFALDSLVKSMKWDEDTYGLEYDLDVFNIVSQLGTWSLCNAAASHVIGLQRICQTSTGSHLTPPCIVAILLCVLSSVRHAYNGGRLGDTCTLYSMPWMH